MTEFDLFSDEKEPEVTHTTTITSYRVRVPSEAQSIDVMLDVYDDGLVDIKWYKWFGEDSRDYDRKVATATIAERNSHFEIKRQIMEYLSEWDLVELKRIGPEDSEWFATEELTAND